jgi:HNH endonuclease
MPKRRHGDFLKQTDNDKEGIKRPRNEHKEASEFIRVEQHDEYEINRAGVIRNCETKHQLTPNRNPNGYLYIQLNGRTHLLHRLVANAFVSNKDPVAKKLVNHLNGNRGDCRADNLEWCTPSENSLHAITRGRPSYCRPVLQLDATTGDVIQEFPSTKAASKAMGMKAAGAVCRSIGKNKLCATFRWKYKYERPNSLPATSLPGELWLTVKDHSKYKISNKGRIKNKLTGKLLLTQNSGLDGDGYDRVALCSGSPTIQQKVFIHRLVAEAFLPVPKVEAVFVNHKDLNKRNNSLENLEWVTPSENIEHAHGRCVAQIDPVDGSVLKTFKSGNAASKSIGMPSYTVHNAINSNTFPIVGGFRWQFVESQSMENKSKSISLPQPRRRRMVGLENPNDDFDSLL